MKTKKSTLTYKQTGVDYAKMDSLKIIAQKAGAHRWGQLLEGTRHLAAHPLTLRVS